MVLTTEQLGALRWWWASYGRKAKAKLQVAWSAGLWPRDSDKCAALQQLRNQLGPAWLAKYRPGDTQVGWLCIGAMPVEDRGARGPLSCVVWHIADASGVSMISPVYCRTKADARSLARQLNITLIEDHLP